MRVSVEIPKADLQEICRITGISKKSTAIRKLVADTLLLHRRTKISGNFLSGEWSAELESFEAGRSVDRSNSVRLSELWRD